jgi:hypothetical protein
MRKRLIFTLLLFCFIILLSFIASFWGCRAPVDSLDKEQVISQVKESLQEKLGKDVTYKGITVSEVSLIKEPPNKFTGSVEYSCNGHTETVDIVVTIDKDLAYIYECDYPKSLLAYNRIFSEISIEFSGWFVGNSPVTSAKKSDNVIAKLIFSWGQSGSYTIEVRRDISWAPDETITQLQFVYDGYSSTQQISFIPPYMTDEAGTNGYHIDILRGSDTIWTMQNSYPPRLRVTSP